IGIIQPVCFIAWLDNVIAIKNIKGDKQQYQKRYAPALQEIRKSARYRNQYRKENRYTRCRGQLEQRSIQPKTHYNQEYEGDEYRKHRRKVMTAENSLNKLATIVRYIAYFFQLENIVQVPFHFDKAALAQLCFFFFKLRFK